MSLASVAGRVSTHSLVWEPLFVLVRSQTTADIYTHIAEKLQQGAAESMDAVLRGAPEHRSGGAP